MEKNSMNGGIEKMEAKGLIGKKAVFLRKFSIFFNGILKNTYRSIEFLFDNFKDSTAIEI